MSKDNTPELKVIEPIHDKLPDGKDVTILPYNSYKEASERLLCRIEGVMNDVIEEGTEYPQLEKLDRQGFLDYYFSNFVAVMVEGNVQTKETWDMDKNQFLGCFYIKPNYVGRASHICNAGFLVPKESRGRKIGKTMGRNYIKMAPKLGYDYSVFNLVFKSNVASVKIWDDLGFDRIGLVPRAADLKGLGYVDAIVFGYSFNKPSN